MRKRLFTWAMEDLEILAFADLSFHGKENVVKHMQEIDKDRYQKAVFFHTPVEEKCYQYYMYIFDSRCQRYKIFMHGFLFYSNFKLFYVGLYSDHDSV